jgi:hypothetical protein
MIVFAVTQSKCLFLKCLVGMDQGNLAVVPGEPPDRVGDERVVDVQISLSANAIGIPHIRGPPTC